MRKAWVSSSRFPQARSRLTCFAAEFQSLPDLTSIFRDGPPTESGPISLSVAEAGQVEGPGVVSGVRRVPLLRAGTLSCRDR
jgi:hypothetical protein